jgi:hypothetical protein
VLRSATRDAGACRQHSQNLSRFMLETKRTAVFFVCKEKDDEKFLRHKDALPLVQKIYQFVGQPL